MRDATLVDVQSFLGVGHMLHKETENGDKRNPVAPTNMYV
jgi:hypothetical protein